MFVKKILMIMTALFLFCGCAAKPAKTSVASVEQTEAEKKQNSSVSENADQKHSEKVPKDKKQTSNAPSEKESAKPETEKEVSKAEKKSKSKKNTVSSEKKLSSSPVISDDASDSHIHDWIHHEATGHYETKTVTDKEARTETVVDQAAWDETVVTGYQCVTCKQVFNTMDEIETHLESSEDCGSNYTLLTTAVHHSALTHDVNHPAETHQENVWIQDSTAYDECSICGAKKIREDNK